jgi:hypothetical protein
VRWDRRQRLPQREQKNQNNGEGNSDHVQNWAVVGGGGVYKGLEDFRAVHIHCGVSWELHRVELVNTSDVSEEVGKPIRYCMIF